MLDFKELQFQFKETGQTFRVDELRPDIEKALAKPGFVDRLSHYEWESLQSMLSSDHLSNRRLRERRKVIYLKAVHKLEVQPKPLSLYKIEKPHGPLEEVLADERFMEFAYGTGLAVRNNDTILKDLPALTANYELTARQAQIWRAYGIGRLTSTPEVVLKVFGEYKPTHHQNVKVHWFRSLESLKNQGMDLSKISIPSRDGARGARGIGCFTDLSPQELRAAKAIVCADSTKGISNLGIGKVLTDGLVDDYSARRNARVVLVRLENKLPPGLDFDTKREGEEVYTRFVAT